MSSPSTHRLTWAQQDSVDDFVVECACGATFRRTRLADAAIALERHQHHPTSFRGDHTMERT